jgi:hypothetical protein
MAKRKSQNIVNKKKSILAKKNARKITNKVSKKKIPLINKNILMNNVELEKDSAHNIEHFSLSIHNPFASQSEYYQNFNSCMNKHIASSIELVQEGLSCKDIFGMVELARKWTSLYIQTYINFGISSYAAMFEQQEHLSHS